MHPKLKDYEVHPVAEMFPLMDEKSAEWLQFVDSIRERGQLDPLIVDGNTLLDGRNRLRACHALKIEPRVQEWESLGLRISQADWIATKNLDRRHLTDDQKASITAEVYRWQVEHEAEEAKKAAQFKNGNDGGPGRGKTAHPKRGEPVRDTKAEHARSSAGKVASKARVSRRKAEQALKLNKAAQSNPKAKALEQEVKDGSVKLREAVAALEPEQQPKPAKTLRERVHEDIAKMLGKYTAKERNAVKSLILEMIQ